MGSCSRTEPVSGGAQRDDDFADELRRTHPQVTCVLLHPGTVDTPLSKPFQLNVPAEKLFDAPRAAQQLLAVIASMTPSRSGSFLAWDGQTIPS